MEHSSSFARSLGATDVAVSPIGLGCWQFSQGRGLAGTFWPDLEDHEIAAIVRVSLAGGVTWFDTAEMYGRGASERALSRSLRDLGVRSPDVVVATKWLPLGRFAGSIRRTIVDRLTALQGFGIDLYQVHQPWSFSSPEAEMEAMADLVDAGVVRAVGVSNFDERRMRRAHAALRRRGIPLASNQVSYSLLDRSVERHGLLDAARELEVTIIAYSPLSQGLLTGAYHDDPERIRRRPGVRKWSRSFGEGNLQRTRPLVDELRRVGESHGASPAQIALNWLIHRHGEAVVVIPGATSEQQAADNAAAMGFRLSPAEIERIDAVSRVVAS